MADSTCWRWAESVLIVEIAERLIRLHGLRPYIDIPITFTGMRPGEVLSENLLGQGESRHSTSTPYVTAVEYPSFRQEGAY